MIDMIINKQRSDLQGLPLSSTADDGRDSDSCNIGSPTADSGNSLRTCSPFSEDRTSAVDSTRCRRRPRPAAHVLYRLAGTVEGFEGYLRDAGSLLLLLVRPAAAMVQAATALSARAAEPTYGVQLGRGWSPQQGPQQLVSQADEVAVGRVAVSLHDLAASGEAEGARLYVTSCELTILCWCTAIVLMAF